MSLINKIVASLLLSMISAMAFAITDAQVFAFAEANYPSIFTGTATAGVFPPYNYRYYPASGNYLAVDTSGEIFILGPYTGNVISSVGLSANYASTITAWEAGTAGAATSTGLLGGTIQRASLNLVGTVTTYAGSTGTNGFVDGTATAARFNQPRDITTDGTNLYVADKFNNSIRKVVISTGVVTTIAGNGLAGSADGTGTMAQFNSPKSITTDGTNLYVADSLNSTIRKVVIATGVVTTIAGGMGTPGSTDGTGTAARFDGLNGITTDGTNLYVADANSNTIRKVVIATGVVTTIAGSTGTTGSTDGTGTAALFNSPIGITTDGTSLYVGDLGNHTIRKIAIATGVVTTIAGSPGVFGSADGIGSAALFDSPGEITTDGTNLYVANEGNATIRKVVISTGVVTTISGFGDVRGMTTDGTSLFAVDMINTHTIRKIQ